jgi:hypothetical protein
LLVEQAKDEVRRKNGAYGINDMEGKIATVATSKRGRGRVSIKKSDLRLPVSSLKLVCFPALAATRRGFPFYLEIPVSSIPRLKQ